MVLELKIPSYKNSYIKKWNVLESETWSYSFFLFFLDTRHSLFFIQSESLVNFCASTGLRAMLRNIVNGALKCRINGTLHSHTIISFGLSCSLTFHSSLNCTCTCLLNAKRFLAEDTKLLLNFNELRFLKKLLRFIV